MRYKAINAISTAASITGDIVDLEFTFVISVQFNWTGTTAGTVYVEGSNDLINWTTLPNSSATPAGSAGSFLYEPGILNGVLWVRPRFTRTSGSGSMTAWVGGKEELAANSSTSDLLATMNLENKYVRTTRFVSIGSGTSGTITLPANSTVVLDDFGGTVDAVVSSMSGGRPTNTPSFNGGGTAVATTFNSSGAYSFSSTPASYPVGLVYRVQQKLKDFDSDSLDIIGGPEIINSGGGTSTLATNNIFIGNASNVATAAALTGDATIAFSSPNAVITVNSVQGFTPDSANNPNTLMKRDSGGFVEIGEISITQSIFGVPEIFDPTGSYVTISVGNNQLRYSNNGVAYDWELGLIRDMSGLYAIDLLNRALVSTPGETYVLQWGSDEGITINGYLNLGQVAVPSVQPGGFNIFRGAVKHLSFYTGTYVADNDFSALSRDRTYIWPDSDGTIALGGPFIPTTGGNVSGTLTIDPSSDVVALYLNKGSGFTTDLYKYTFAGGTLAGMRSDARTYWGTSAGSSSISNLFVARNPADSVIVAKGGGSQTGGLFSAQNTGGTELSNISASGTFLAPPGTNSLPALSFLADIDTGIYNSAANNIDIATNAIRRLNVDANGNIRAFTLHNNATTAGSASNQDIRSGTYTPTLTNTANISASTAYKSQWMRVGNVVTVSGKVDITGTITLTSTTLGISLPVASNLANEQDLAGTAFCPTVAGNGAAILADGTNDRATLKFVVTGVAADSYFYTFTYEVI